MSFIDQIECPMCGEFLEELEESGVCLDCENYTLPEFEDDESGCNIKSKSPKSRSKRKILKTNTKRRVWRKKRTCGF